MRLRFCTAGFWRDRCAQRSWGTAMSYRTLADECDPRQWRRCS